MMEHDDSRTTGESGQPLDRRSFLKLAGTQTGLLAAGAASTEALHSPFIERAPAFGQNPPDIVVIGAGAFGGWTAMYLQRLGARVTLVDTWGPGNSRATSGDETRGIRSSYGDRGERSELWCRWAREAIRRWKAWDEEWGRELRMRLFFTSGDIILRANAQDNFVSETRKVWDKLATPYELLSIDDSLRTLIHDGASEGRLRDYARARGMRTIRDDGLRWVRAGATSLEEVLRVTRE